MGQVRDGDTGGDSTHQKNTHLSILNLFRVEMIKIDNFKPDC